MTLTAEETERAARHKREDREARSASCVHCGRAVSHLDRCSDGTFLHPACAVATQTSHRITIR